MNILIFSDFHEENENTIKIRKERITVKQVTL